MVAPKALVREQLSGELQQPITSVACSADGEFLALATAGGELLLLDFRAGCEELLRAVRDISLDAIGFSPDDRFLMAVGQGGELLLWELGGTGTRPLPLDPIPLAAGWLDKAAWQPQGSLLAVAAGRQVRLWDGDSRQLLHQGLELPGTVMALDWSADGTRLAASGNDELALWQPLASPAARPLRLPTASAAMALAFSPLGHLLAAGLLGRSLLVWPKDGEGQPWQFRGFPAKVRQLAWSDRAGRLAPSLAVASAESVVLWTHQITSSRSWTPEPLLWHGQRVNDLAFASGSGLLATGSADGTVALWDRQGHLRQTLEGDGQGFHALAWRPDGLHLAAGGDQGRWWLWPVAVPASERPCRSGGIGFG